MKGHDTGRATVDRLADAKVGDKVWIMDMESSLYVDGVYQGRGVWLLREVKEVGRMSLLTNGSKFDRKTGAQRNTRGFSANYHAYGELDRDDKIWNHKHRREIMDRMDRIDIAMLRQVAMYGNAPTASSSSRAGCTSTTATASRRSTMPARPRASSPTGNTISEHSPLLTPCAPSPATL